MAHSQDFSNSYLLYQWSIDHVDPVSMRRSQSPDEFESGSDFSDSSTSDSEDSELEESAIIGRKFGFLEISCMH